MCLSEVVVVDSRSTALAVVSGVCGVSRKFLLYTVELLVGPRESAIGEVEVVVVDMPPITPPRSATGTVSHIKYIETPI